MTAKSVSIVTCILGLLLSTFAVAAPFWIILQKEYIDGAHVRYYYGLWHVCVKLPFEGLFCEFVEVLRDSDIAVVRYVHLPAQVVLLLCVPCIVLGSKQRGATVFACLMAFLAGCCFVGSYVLFVVKVGPASLANIHEEGVKLSYHACFYADIVASVLCFITCGALVKLTISSSKSIMPSPRINEIDEDGVPLSSRRPVDAWVHSPQHVFTRREAKVIDDDPLSEWPGIPRSSNNTPQPCYSMDSSFVSPQSSRRQQRHHLNTLTVSQRNTSSHGISRDSTLDSDILIEAYSLTSSRNRAQNNLNF